MKHIFSLVLLTLTTILTAQKNQDVHTLYFDVDCPSNNIEAFYEQDSSYAHYIWLEVFNGTDWDSIPSSVDENPPSTTYFSYIVLGILYTNDYRLLFMNATLDTIYILDTLHVDFGHYMGLESYNLGEITRIENYDDSDHRVKELTTVAVYFEHVIYSNNRITTR